MAGLKLTVLTGDIAGVGLLSSGHSIVYWEYAGTGYLVSVHYDDDAAVAFEIAVALAKQMVECPPKVNSENGTEAPCDLVFAHASPGP